MGDLGLGDTKSGLWALGAVRTLSRPGSPWRPFNLIFQDIPFSAAFAVPGVPPSLCPTSQSCLTRLKPGFRARRWIDTFLLSCILMFSLANHCSRWHLPQGVVGRVP